MFALLLLITNSQAFASNIHYEDLSILFPLNIVEMPNQSSQSIYKKLISMNQKGGKGKLVSKKLMKELPNTNNEFRFENLKVVGVRLDPCFQEDTQSACQYQVRLIAQHISLFNGEMKLHFGANHFFYDISKKTYKNIIKNLIKIRKKYKYDQLKNSLSPRPHQAITEDEYGDYFKELKDIVLSNIGIDNLIRISFNSHNKSILPGKNAVMDWAFGGINIQNKKVKDIEIPNIHFPYSPVTRSFHNGRKVQVIRVSDHYGEPVEMPGYPDEFFQQEDSAPIPVGTNQISDSVNIFSEYIKTFVYRTSQLSLETIQIQIDRANKIENPLLSHSGNTDCLSCHRAHLITDHFFTNSKHDELCSNINLNNNAYSSVTECGNMQVNSLDTGNFIMFGYFPLHYLFTSEMKPSYSRRTLHETNEVYKKTIKLLQIKQ